MAQADFAFRSRPFREGLRQTVEWYRTHEAWWRPLKEQSPEFRDHYRRHYGSKETDTL